MSMIMRGMGPSPRLVTSGFGPPDPPPVVATVSDAILDYSGRSSPLYEELAKSLWINTYTIRAALLSVNGVLVKNPEEKKMIAENDTRDGFSAKVSENIRVTKTNSKERIFINAISAFKRK
jgi:hypothetical protein